MIRPRCRRASRITPIPTTPPSSSRRGGPEQIDGYFHKLGEGGFGDYPPPMVETNAESNYLAMALEELAEGKLKDEYRS